MLSPRDAARRQYWIDWVDAICEDLRRELWATTPRERRKLYALGQRDE